MVKVGDKIRILKDRASGANVRKGDEFIVDSLEGGGSVTVEGPKNWMFNKASYSVISQPVYTIPADTETVTLKYADGSTQDIDVKDRARGVPEWVKDGQWVVHKENGELSQLIEGELGYFKAVNKKTWYPFVLDFHSSMTVSDIFRPFTNSDWKWGMWAEYRGEKVFVNGPHGAYGATVSSPNNGCFYVRTSELTPTTAP